jgi:isopenicillin-N epimerase
VRPYGPDSPWRFRPGLTFLNHGSFGACPIAVLAAQRRWIDELEADPIQVLDRDMGARLAAARDTVAAFLGADPEGLAFVPNATAGVSTVLRSLDLRAGDELLTTDHEYNATLNALDVVAARSGARVVRVRIPLPIDDPDEVVARVVGAATGRTRLALVSHVTSPTAIVLPIDRIVRELEVRGVDTLVDAAHAPGMVPVRVDGLGAAYWTGNGHKWCCAPKGAAVLHVRADRRGDVEPLVISHGWNDRRTDRSDLRKRFDWTGTADPTPFLGLAEAIRFMATLHPDGWPGLMAENRAAAVAARERLLDGLGGRALAPAAMLGSMAAVELPAVGRSDAAARALQTALRADAGIEVPIVAFPVPAARPDPAGPPDRILVRVSLQRYNEPADVDALAAALERLVPATVGAG